MSERSITSIVVTIGLFLVATLAHPTLAHAIDLGWIDHFGNPGQEFAWGIDTTSSAIYVAGEGDVDGITEANFVRKYSPDGTVLWTGDGGTRWDSDTP